MNMLDARREETTGRLEWLLSLEDGEPFTLSSELLRTFFFGGKEDHTYDSTRSRI